MWTMHLDPTGADVIGTPYNITINTAIFGELEATGSNTAAYAGWNVLVDDGTLQTVMAGNASQTTPGLSNFSDSGSVTITVPIGGTFQFGFFYDLNAIGTAAPHPSSSRAELLTSAGPSLLFARSSTPSATPTTAGIYFTIEEAIVDVVVPEPATFGLVAMAIMVGGMRRRRVA